MSSRGKLWGIALAMTCVMLASEAWGRGWQRREWSKPNAERVAGKSIELLTKMADRYAGRNEKKAAWCVEEIRELLGTGQPEEALELGDRCIDRINRCSDVFVRVAERICETCVRVLERMEASEELIQQVRTACEEAIQTVQQSQQAAVAAIEAELPA